MRYLQYVWYCCQHPPESQHTASEKFDAFVAVAVDGLATMADTVDPKDCPCALNVDSVKCLWHLLHKDLREISVKSTIGNLMSNELSTRAGQRRAQQNLLLDQAGLTQRCLERLKSYSRSLGNNLYAKVFQSEDKKMVESIRVVLDLETLAIKLKLSGSAHVSAVQTKLFIQKSRELAPQLAEISDDELRLQYRDFLRKLESQIEDQDEDTICSMDIFKSFLSSDLLSRFSVLLHVQSLLSLGCLSMRAIVTSIDPFQMTGLKWRSVWQLMDLSSSMLIQSSRRLLLPCIRIAWM